jgi:hypothetical protein
MDNDVGSIIADMRWGPHGGQHVNCVLQGCDAEYHRSKTTPRHNPEDDNWHLWDVLWIIILHSISGVTTTRLASCMRLTGVSGTARHLQKVLLQIDKIYYFSYK